MSRPEALLPAEPTPSPKILALAAAISLGNRPVKFPKWQTAMLRPGSVLRNPADLSKPRNSGEVTSDVGTHPKNPDQAVRIVERAPGGKNEKKNIANWVSQTAS